VLQFANTAVEKSHVIILFCFKFVFYMSLLKLFGVCVFQAVRKKRLKPMEEAEIYIKKNADREFCVKKFVSEEIG